MNDCEKTKNRVKRLTDVLEKLGVGGMVLGIFQDNQTGLIGGILLVIASVLLTFEERE